MEVLQATKHFGADYSILLIFALMELIEPGVSEAFDCCWSLIRVCIKHLSK